MKPDNTLREQTSLWVVEAHDPDFQSDPEAQRRLYDWLNKSDAHATAYASASRAFQRLSTPELHLNIDLSPLIHAHRRQQLHERRLRLIKRCIQHWSLRLCRTDSALRLRPLYMQHRSASSGPTSFRTRPLPCWRIFPVGQFESLRPSAWLQDARASFDVCWHAVTSKSSRFKASSRS